MSLTPADLQFNYDIYDIIGYPSIDGLSQVVSQFSWKYYGFYTDSNNKYWQGNQYGMTTVPTTGIDNFIPYDQLTKQQFWDWVLQSGQSESQIQNNIVSTIINEQQPPPPMPVPFTPPF